MTLIIPLLRADARRPASWMALLLAVAGAWQCAGRTGSAGAVAAWLCGGALAVAAIGAPLPASAAPFLRADAWASLRVAWPATGALLGTAARIAFVGDAGSGASARLLLFLLGGCAALVVRLAAARGGEAEADGASLSLAFLGTAALAGHAMPRVEGVPWLAGLSIVAVWSLLAAALPWLARVRENGPGIAAIFSGRGGGASPGLLAPLRRVLVGAAMAMTLGGMAWWLFLEPRRAVDDLWASLLGFVALAAPVATIGDERLDPALGRLLEAGPRPGLGGPDRAPRRRSGGGRPRVATGVLALVWLHAAVIAWPSVVAAALLLGDRPRALAAIGIAAAVASAAALLGTLASRRLALGQAETRLAASLALAIAVGLAASR